MQLQQAQEEFRQRNATVLVVTFEDARQAAAYLAETNFPWPLLLDPERRLYLAYGMERGSTRDVMGWESWKIYMRLFLRGRHLRRPTGDVYQLGGDVLVNPAGTAIRVHIGKGPADRPTVAQILRWIDADRAA